MAHISIWLNFQTWHWTKWTSLVDRLHWSIPIKVKGYLQNDQISTVPLKKYCFFCFCLFSLQNHFLHFLLTLLRVARKPSSVGWPTPKTGKPFTYGYETLYYITWQVRSFFFCEIVFSQNFVHLPKVGCPFHFLHFFRQKVHPWVRKWYRADKLFSLFV